MRRSSPARILYILAIICAAVPFAFGVARAIRTGKDLRYLWLAIVAGLATAVVVTVASARRWDTVFAQSGSTLVVVTLAVAGTSFLLGGAGLGVWVVALAFGLCFAASAGVLALSRPETTGE